MVYPPVDMALPSTLHSFEVDLSDVDRGVYETLSIRAARHPSETEEFLVTRLLAYCLEYQEGIAFSKGVCEGDEPAVHVRDPGGRYRSWIEVGAPDAGRLHRAAKAAERIAVYATREWHSLKRQYEGQRIHRGEEIPIYTFDRGLVRDLVSLLDRRMEIGLSRSGGELYLDAGGRSLTGAVTEHRIQP
jgi:uncharacterized protein YaeQ